MTCHSVLESIVLDSIIVKSVFMDSENTRFKAARLSLGLTLKDVASKISYSVGAISGVENGHDTQACASRTLLIEFMHINESWLRTGKGEMFSISTTEAIAEAKKPDTKFLTSAEERQVEETWTETLRKRFAKMSPEERERFAKTFSGIIDLAQAGSNKK